VMRWKLLEARAIEMGISITISLQKRPLHHTIPTIDNHQ